MPVRMDFRRRWETFACIGNAQPEATPLKKAMWHIERVDAGVGRVAVAALHWRWQFRGSDLLPIPPDLNATLGGDQQGEGLEPGKISAIRRCASSIA